LRLAQKLIRQKRHGPIAGSTHIGCGYSSSGQARRASREAPIVYVYAPLSRYGVALLRAVVGVIFVWAGADKVFNGGQSGNWTAQAFLKFATNGSLGWPFVIGTPDPKHVYNPTHVFWVSLAGNDLAMTVVNNLVVAGEVCIGIALIVGVATRFAGVMGALMMAFFFLAGWSFTNGIVEEHATYAVVLLALAGMGAGNYYGLDRIVGGRFPVWFRNWFMSGDPNPPAVIEPVPAA
jgi:thiosulfate dehydrogenase [quinone] large subunit